MPLKSKVVSCEVLPLLRHSQSSPYHLYLFVLYCTEYVLVLYQSSYPLVQLSGQEAAGKASSQTTTPTLTPAHLFTYQVLDSYQPALDPRPSTTDPPTTTEPTSLTHSLTPYLNILDIYS